MFPTLLAAPHMETNSHHRHNAHIWHLQQPHLGGKTGPRPMYQSPSTSYFSSPDDPTPQVTGTCAVALPTILAPDELSSQSSWPHCRSLLCIVTTATEQNKTNQKEKVSNPHLAIEQEKRRSKRSVRSYLKEEVVYCTGAVHYICILDTPHI